MSESTNSMIVIDGTRFAVRTLKSGKQVRRTTLGVLTSGNKDERAQLSQAALAACIDNHSYGPVVHEMVRVFGAAAFKKSTAFIAAGTTLYTQEADGTLVPLGDKANKATAIAVATAVIAYMVGKEAKGEKAMYLAGAVRIIDNAKRAEEARKDAAQTQETEVPQLTV